MIESPENRRSAMTPQLAVRVTVIGSFALMMFAIIFFRLWFLQVLSTNQYAEAAKTNRVRTIDIPAPRGEIVDRNGNLLVESVPTIDVQISPTDLPRPAVQANVGHPSVQDRSVYIKLSKVLGISTKHHRCKVLNQVLTLHRADGSVYHKVVYIYPQLAPVACLVAQKVTTQPSYQNVTIQQDVSKYVQYYLAERQNDYPGVEVKKVYRRSYPYTRLAAQLFGTIGPITKPETTMHRYKGYSPNAVIGQSGLEYEYDKYLRGTDGQEQVQVNALGQFEGDLKGKKAVTGNTLKLSLDTKLQQVGEEALAHSVGLNASDGGAFVAMNPVSGQVYAMGSNPSFDPTDFTRAMSQSYYDSHYRDASSNFPLDNRAIDGGGPDGSTFKPITATAALESGVWSVGQTYDDSGQYCFTGSTLCLHNSGHAAFGSVNLVDALRVSDDVFFYNLGAQLNADPATHPQGGALQTWAHDFGIGRLTGIDLPGESPGAFPSPEHLKSLYKQEVECENATGPYKGHPKHPSSEGGCGIANNPYWTIGDNVNAAVGQGDDQVTPLQLTVAYAALANGGTVVKPHVGMQIDSPDGTVLQNLNPPPERHLPIDSAYLDTIRTGLREAASQPGGTSYDVMGNFPQQVYGKTGTAQYNGQQDYAWYACFVPPTATSQPIVVVVWVERGGFGDVAAAPVARQILSQWFYGKPGPYQAGTSTTL